MSPVQYRKEQEMSTVYEYRARLSRVVDGDTVDLEVDLGFHMKADLRFRVLDLDTPELRGGTDESKAKARLAKERVQELLSSEMYSVDWPLVIRTRKADSFGRWLAAIWIEPKEGVSINLAEKLILEGHGVPWRK